MGSIQPGPEVINLFSCSTQLSTKFQLLIKTKIPANEEVYCFKGVQWLNGIVLDLKPRGCGFEPHWRHCVVVLEQDTFILA